MKYVLFLSLILIGLIMAFIYGPTILDDYNFLYFDKAEKNKTVAVLFGGDMMFDRYIRKIMQESGEDHIFSCIVGELKKADMVVANLEGPITSNSSVSLGSVPGGENNYTFTFDDGVARLLKRSGISTVNIGNNHITNFGDSGVRETLDFLDGAGVGYFGDPFFYKTFEKEINGVKFSFISYNQFGGEAEDTILKIKNAKQNGFLPIVYTHWGQEYKKTQEALVPLAHSFIDVGAEVVIGSHPHVVGDIEEYGGKKIFYSLGNFIFDQYFNENVRNGILVEIVFGKNGVVSYKEIPIEIFRDGRTCVKKSMPTH